MKKVKILILFSCFSGLNSSDIGTTKEEVTRVTSATPTNLNPNEEGLLYSPQIESPSIPRTSELDESLFAGITEREGLINNDEAKEFINNSVKEFDKLRKITDNTKQFEIFINTVLLFSALDKQSVLLNLKNFDPILVLFYLQTFNRLIENFYNKYELTAYDALKIMKLYYIVNQALFHFLLMKQFSNLNFSIKDEQILFNIIKEHIKVTNKELKLTNFESLITTINLLFYDPSDKYKYGRLSTATEIINTLVKELTTVRLLSSIEKRRADIIKKMINDARNIAIR